MYRLNRSGLRLQPCQTPFWQGKDDENSLSTLTLEVVNPY